MHKELEDRDNEQEHSSGFGNGRQKPHLGFMCSSDKLVVSPQLVFSGFSQRAHL